MQITKIKNKIQFLCPELCPYYTKLMLSYLDYLYMTFWIQGQRKGNLFKRFTMLSEKIIIIFQGFFHLGKIRRLHVKQGVSPFWDFLPWHV
jgi:hypothetical protein